MGRLLNLMPMTVHATDQTLANGREFMYRYDSTNTVANPNGTPNGFIADGPGGPSYEGQGQFTIFTGK